MRMRQSEINELKDLAFHKAREFPCEQLLNEAGYMTRTRGDKIFSQCPNCGKIGKKGDSCITHSMFSITKSKMYFHVLVAILKVDQQRYMHTLTMYPTLKRV